MWRPTVVEKVPVVGIDMFAHWRREFWRQDDRYRRVFVRGRGPLICSSAKVVIQKGRDFSDHE